MVTEIVELLREKKLRQFFILSLHSLAADAAPNANDSTASHLVSDVKDVSAQLVLRWVTESEMQFSFFELVCGGCGSKIGDMRFDP